MDDLDAINLDEDIGKIYDLMDDDALKREHAKSVELNKLRNENHKRYYKINMVKLKNLPTEFNTVVDDIADLYKKLVKKDILNDNEQNSIQTKKVLDKIYLKINRVESMIKTTIKELEEYNDKKQTEFSIVDLKNLDVDEKSKRKALNLYNELVLYSANIKKDIYENLKHQLIRKNYIDDILKVISKGRGIKLNNDRSDKTKELNYELNKVIEKTNEEVQYLSDLMSKDADNQDTLNNFLSFYNKILDYDDSNYDNVKQTLDILSDSSKFKDYANKFKKNFDFDIKESNYWKVKLVNIKSCFYYIKSNYMDFFDKPRKLVIEDMASKIEKDDINVDIIIKNLGNIVNYIWEKTLTGVKEKENFYILCSNSQFVEPKTEVMLLSRKILNNMDDYLDYQIGFICDYNKDILYITQSKDIMEGEHSSLSKLKTPRQIEQEYIDLKVVNRIALDGYKVKLVGVYFIDDGDKVKYDKALELSKDNNLPLLCLKKQG